ncbi:hypothetical protein HF319_04015 [Xanthomonas sp. Kuri4-1]
MTISVRAIAMTLVGAVCTGEGVWSVLHPHRLAAVNRGGLLYEKFGEQGVAWGTLALGGVMLVGGLAWLRHGWRSGRR